LDNHVVDYVPPSVLQEKSILKNKTKDGLLGMALVGAISTDPRLVNTSFLSRTYKQNINKHLIVLVHHAICGFV
jgi:hypothetical protein